MKFNITIKYEDNPPTSQTKADFNFRLESDFDDEAAAIVKEILMNLQEKVLELQSGTKDDAV